MDGLTDSFDLVPIAAWVGKGKRTGVYGAYLLACYDPDEEVYQAICKVGTGFSEEMLTELTEVSSLVVHVRTSASAPLTCILYSGLQLKGMLSINKAEQRYCWGIPLRRIRVV